VSAHCPSPEAQVKLSHLQKREAHMQYPTYQAAGWPIGSGSVESAGHPESSKPASKGPACAGSERTSTPCWCCAMRSAIGSGRRRGRQREESDKPSAPVSGTQTESLGWPVLCGPSSSGECGSIGSPTPLFRLPLHRGLRSSRSNQFVVLGLAIPGASLFSGGLLPPLCFQQSLVQKNETHPLQSPSLTLLLWSFILFA